MDRVSITNPIGIREQKYPLNRWTFKRSLASNDKYIKMQDEMVEEQEENQQFLDPSYLSLQYKDDELYTSVCPNNIRISSKENNSLFIRQNPNSCDSLYKFVSGIFDLEIEPIIDENESLDNFQDYKNHLQMQPVKLDVLEYYPEDENNKAIINEQKFEIKKEPEPITEPDFKPQPTIKIKQEEKQETVEEKKPEVNSKQIIYDVDSEEVDEIEQTSLDLAGDKVYKTAIDEFDIMLIE